MGRSYGGKRAKQIGADMRENDGPLRHSDLASMCWPIGRDRYGAVSGAGGHGATMALNVSKVA